MLDSPRSSQLSVSQGDSHMCKEEGLYRVHFLPVHAVGGQLCFMSTAINSHLGFRASGVVFAGSSGMSSVIPVAEPALLCLRQTSRSWSGGLSAGPGSLEGGDGASEPRSSGWK